MEKYLNEARVKKKIITSRADHRGIAATHRGWSTVVEAAAVAAAASTRRRRTLVTREHGSLRRNDALAMPTSVAVRRPWRCVAAVGVSVGAREHDRPPPLHRATERTPPAGAAAVGALRVSARSSRLCVGVSVSVCRCAGVPVFRCECACNPPPSPPPTGSERIDRARAAPRRLGPVDHHQRKRRPDFWVDDGVMVGSGDGGGGGSRAAVAFSEARATTTIRRHHRLRRGPNEARAIDVPGVFFI